MIFFLLIGLGCSIWELFIMNWEAIGVAGEIIGAIAVLATLIYLAVQVRESSKAKRLQTVQSTFHLSFEMVSLFTNGKNLVV
jgi:ABC-type molybdate transport system permease subunit